jgi:hypothetical protein
MAQNLETQLEFPEMENNDSSKQKSKKGLRPRTYGIIGAIALTLGGASYMAYDFVQTMKGMNPLIEAVNAFSPEKITNDAMEGLDNYFEKREARIPDSNKEIYPQKSVEVHK